MRELRHRLGILKRQGLLGASGAAYATTGRGARGDGEDVGAQAGEALVHALIYTLGERNYRDDSRDTDNHAQHGQKRAHAIGLQRFKCAAKDSSTDAGWLARWLPMLPLIFV